MLGLHKNHPTAYFDGARGIAVLFVWLSHTSGRGQGMADWLSFHGIGHVGVMFFFVLSGFLLSMPFNKARSFSVSAYLIRRFLRIAPLYYLVVTGVYIYQIQTGQLHDRYLHLYDGFTGYLQHLLFLKGDGIFWTIPAEFMFYLILPLIALFLLKQQAWRYAIIISLALAYGFYHFLIIANIIQLPSLMIAEIKKHSQYFDVFIIGLIFGMLTNNIVIKAYYLANKRILDVLIFSVFITTIFATLAFVSSQFLFFEQPFYFVRFLSFMYALAFGAALYSAFMGNQYLKLVFCFRPLIFMGVVGYSWYLLHMPVVQYSNYIGLSGIAGFIISTLAMVLICTVTYFSIEEPFIRLGKRFSKNR